METKIIELKNNDFSKVTAEVLVANEKEALISIVQDRKDENRFDHIVLNKEQIKTLYELSLGK